MSFGKRLLELRKERGLSQEDLAIDLEVSQSSISNYELEFTKPDILFLEKTSEYFKVPIEDFFIDNDNQKFFNYKNENVQNIVYNLPEKLIEQYEETIKTLKEQNSVLKQLLNRSTD